MHSSSLPTQLTAMFRSVCQSAICASCQCRSQDMNGRSANGRHVICGNQLQALFTAPLCASRLLFNSHSCICFVLVFFSVGVCHCERSCTCWRAIRLVPATEVTRHGTLLCCYVAPCVIGDSMCQRLVLLIDQLVTRLTPFDR